MTVRNAETEERLLTGRAGRLSLVLAAGWFALLLGRSALPPLMPEIVSVLQIPPAYAGIALTLMMATHSVLQYPGGRFSDQLTRTTVIVFSLGAAVLGFALVMTATSYPTLLLGMGVVGVGSGLYFSPARAFLSDLYVERLGQALGLQTTAGLSGSALAGGVATVAVAVAVWRATFLLPVVLVVAVAVTLHVLSHEGYRVGAVDLAVRETGARLVARPEVRLLLAVATVRAFANQGVIGFLPLFLQTAKGFSPAFANLSYGALFAVGAVASPIVGNVGDRFPRRRVLAVLLSLFLLGVAVTVVGTSRWAVAAGILLVAAGTWGFAPVMQATLMDSFSAESVGGDFGALKMVYTGVGSLGPTYVGVVAGRASYEVAFGGTVALLAVGVALLVWWSPE